MSFESDFNQDMKNFIQMLKRLLKNHPAQDKLRDSQDNHSGSDINMNIFIFPIIPLSSDEMDEFEEIYDQCGVDDERSHEEMTSQLTDSDLEFLRRYGIRF